MSTQPITRRDFLKLLGASASALLPWQEILPAGFSPRLQAPGVGLPNILILVFDALSATNMSLYGYLRQTTPNIDRLADKATVFHRHYAAANYTTPGTASIFTGVYPWSHRALNLGSSIDPFYIQQNIFSLLSPYYQTFTYTHNGYVNVFFDQFQRNIDEWKPTADLCLDTVAYADTWLSRDFFTAGQAENLILWRMNVPPSSFFLSRFARLRQALSVFKQTARFGQQFPRTVPNSSLSFFTIEDTVEWLKSQTSTPTQPYFGYVHLMPPHFPYHTRAEFADLFNDQWSPVEKPRHFFAAHPEERLRSLRREYDQFIAYVDAEFGRLFAYLEESGALANTLLILTSDHGELFERGIWAHETQVLYEPLLRIPLLVWKPGQTHRQDVHNPTSAVDLLPTLLSLSDAPIPTGIDGQVLPGFRSGVPEPSRSIYSVEAKMNPKYGPLKIATLAMLQEPFKLIRYVGYKGLPETYELYDLEHDPEELNDLYARRPSEAGQMRQELLDRIPPGNPQRP